MKVRGFSGGPKQTSIEKSYELEEILFRIHRARSVFLFVFGFLCTER